MFVKKLEKRVSSKVNPTKPAWQREKEEKEGAKGKRFITTGPVGILANSIKYRKSAFLSPRPPLCSRRWNNCRKKSPFQTLQKLTTISREKLKMRMQVPEAMDPSEEPHHHQQQHRQQNPKRPLLQETFRVWCRNQVADYQVLRTETLILSSPLRPITVSH